MSFSISTNTQVALLLTAPLIAGRAEQEANLFTASEYRRLCALISKSNFQPSDLIETEPTSLPSELQKLLADERVRNLLGRGFLLTQALERWQSRGIWIAGHLDDEYPGKFSNRLHENTPAIIYGCGERNLLDEGGLAVVGSRAVDYSLIAYTEDIGLAAAQAKKPIVSGGARGIDQAAMRGSLQNGGKAVGVMSDTLERAALNREHRDLIMDQRLTLISPYDPAAGFNVGNAMQRNKLIYALADAALVVNSDFEKGGTWSGAIEQLDKLKLVPVYVRSTGDVGKGLEMLQQRGAKPWPNPTTTETFVELLNATTNPTSTSYAEQLSFL
jgi:DNA processing protein